MYGKFVNKKRNNFRIFAQTMEMRKKLVVYSHLSLTVFEVENGSNPSKCKGFESSGFFVKIVMFLNERNFLYGT